MMPGYVYINNKKRLPKIVTKCASQNKLLLSFLQFPQYRTKAEFKSNQFSFNLNCPYWTPWSFSGDWWPASHTTGLTLEPGKPGDLL